jgi:outer membrane immunogenic protein
MKKFLLGSVALAAVIAGPAMAADMPLKAPPPPPVFSWTGCYVGIEGGGVWGRSRHDRIEVGPAATPFFDVTGGLAGVEYGCNQQFGNFLVFGIEGDWSWTNARGSTFNNFNPDNPISTQNQSETREKWISTTRGRIGWAWNRAWLYVTGGLAAAKVEANLTNVVGSVNNNGFPNDGSFSDSHVLYGGTVGAGFEYAFLNNWSLKAEYLYVRLENQDFLFFGRFPQTPVTRGGLNLDNHIVRAGLNWRFTECVFGFPGGCSGP